MNHINKPKFPVINCKIDTINYEFEYFNVTGKCPICNKIQEFTYDPNLNEDELRTSKCECSEYCYIHVSEDDYNKHKMILNNIMSL